MTALYPANPFAFAVVDATIVLYLVWENSEKPLTYAGGIGLLTFLVLLAAQHWFFASAPQSVKTHTFLTNAIDANYPQAGWQMWTQNALSTGLTVTWLLRAATWSGLCLLAAVTAMLLRQSSRLRAEQPAAAES
jgi:hypothetical protein